MGQGSMLPGFGELDRVLMCRRGFAVDIVRECLHLGRFEPAVLGRLQADIELAARQAKKMRLADELWREEAIPLFPAYVDTLEPSDFDSVNPLSLELEAGRPRKVDAGLLLVLVVLDGMYPLSSPGGYERLGDSEVFRAVAEARGMRMPARTTIDKYLGLVSSENRTFVHAALMRMVRCEGLDDCRSLTGDSSAIEANSAWPTESGLISGYLHRAYRMLVKQKLWTTIDCQSKVLERWLVQIAKLHQAISLLPSCPRSVNERRKLYGRLCRLAGQASERIRKVLAEKRVKIETCCIQPSCRVRVTGMMEILDADLVEADKARESARQRVQLKKKLAASEKVFSLADPDCWMIVKGERDPVLGYKPQLGRTANGFISCYEVAAGNPSDAACLLPLAKQHMEHTGVTPALVRTDDGYTSQANLDGLLDMNVETVCFNGAKGRKLLGDELWEGSKEIRDGRSAVESTIFSLKHKCNLRRFRRHGLAGVSADLAQAVLAFNLWRVAFVRRAMFAAAAAPPAA
jgi:hypothetical protein